MKEKRILQALTDIKDAYIEEVALDDVEEIFQDGWSQNLSDKLSQRLSGDKRQGAKYWGYWMGIAASVVLLVMVGVKASDMNWFSTNDTMFVTEIYGELPIDLGFSVAAVHDSIITIEENTQFLTKNPWNLPEHSWNLQKEQLTYPVYKNLSYVSLAGAPAYFSESELLSMAENIAKQLGTELMTWEYSYVQEKENTKYGQPYQICAKSNLAEIIVSGNGKVSVSFEEPVSLPESYIFSNEHTIGEANDVVEYLAKKYEALFDLLSASKLKADCRISYDLEGNRQIYYVAYDAEEDNIFGYCFRNIWFYGDENGLSKISYGDVRTAAEELGTYPILTEAEAMEHLVNGNYVSLLTEDDVKNGTFCEENIAEKELMYLTNSTCQYYQPYYCFYVELGQKAEGLVQYGCFYVPAVADEYAVNFAEESPFGN